MHASKTGPHLTKTLKYEAIAALHALGETDLTPERLKEVQDPEVACLLLQAEVTTVVPDGFLMEGSLMRLDLSAVSIVTQIGDGFLKECTSLTSIDLSGLSNVTVIGSHFPLRLQLFNHPGSLATQQRYGDWQILSSRLQDFNHPGSDTTQERYED